MVTELRVAKRDRTPDAAMVKLLLDVHRVTHLVDTVGEHFGELERSPRLLEAVRGLHAAATRVLDKVEAAADTENVIDGQVWRR